MTRDEIIAYLRTLAADVTLILIIRALRDLQDDSEEEDDDARLPSACLPFEEMVTLLRATVERADALLWRFLYATGLRISEALAVRVADVWGDRVFVRGGKWDLDRYVLLDPVTAELVRAWNWNQPPEALLFEGSPSQVGRRLRRWTAECGLFQKYQQRGERISSHSFRHACATHCYLAGMSYATVDGLLGHGLQSATSVYLHVPFEFVAARYQRAVATRGVPALQRELSRAPGRDEVVERLLAEVPASAELAEVLEFLGRWHIAWLGPFQGEYFAQLHQECPAGEAVTGGRLPYVVPFAAALELCGAVACEEGRLAAWVLAHSGAVVTELASLEFAGIDFASGQVALPGRLAAVDRESLRRLAQWREAHPGRERVFEGDLEGALQEAAARTGWARRFQAVERRFTPLSLRHSCASHLVERGLDTMSLHALLGNANYGTTEHYLETAVGTWREEYRRCHPLASWGGLEWE